MGSLGEAREIILFGGQEGCALDFGLENPADTDDGNNIAE
jgi:hypothetical protein